MSVVGMYAIFTVYMLLHGVYAVYASPLLAQAEDNRSCSILSNSRYNGRVVT
jgi:hypothetical protein